MAKTRDDLWKTKQLMGALARMKPKPHDEMKVGKVKPKVAVSPAKNRRRASPASAKKP